MGVQWARGVVVARSGPPGGPARGVRDVFCLVDRGAVAGGLGVHRGPCWRLPIAHFPPTFPSRGVQKIASKWDRPPRNWGV